MPQLDTSTWFTTIVSTLITLFIIMQLKVSSHHYYSIPEPTLTKATKTSTPWETKWTKIYSPLSLPLR
uniref:ATP synthase complex subunit 8 n=1 Tax=Pteronotus personatus TaxID=118856 RepID=A0A1L2FNE6_PTEPR|nr:ATP synthase F0 subunit 8 [Pteronotus personatus]ANZ01950.1 ATP synthase F0 subunit 8 [Pteronotus personatus]